MQGEVCRGRILGASTAMARCCHSMLLFWLPVASAVTCPLQSNSGVASSYVWQTLAGRQPAEVTGVAGSHKIRPLTTTGLCQAAPLRSSDFTFSESSAGQWVARPLHGRRLQAMVVNEQAATPTAAPSLTVSTPAAPEPSPLGIVEQEPQPTTALPTLQVGVESCSQTLDALSVTAGPGQSPRLQLHYAGCGKSTSTIDVEMRTSFGSAAGTEVVDFMCKVSPQLCTEARLPPPAPTAEPEEQVEVKGFVGDGLCSGDGVVPEQTAATSSSDCRSICQSRIEQVHEDASATSCTGFSWEDSTGSCIVYSGWPIQESSKEASPHASCFSMQSVRRLAETVLNLEDVLGLGAHLQIQPNQAGCFETFDWYSMQQQIDISHQDHELIQKLCSVNANSTILSRTSSDGNGLSKVAVQPACFKDCAGQLTGSCLEGATIRGIEEEVSSTEPVPDAHPMTRGGDYMLEVAGADVFDDLFSNTHGIWVWLLVFSLGSMVLSLILVAALMIFFRPRPEKANGGQETFRLVYEGENGDEEVLLTRNGVVSAGPMLTQPGLLSTNYGPLSTNYAPMSTKYAPMSSKQGGLFSAGF